MGGQIPVIVLKEGTQRETGREATKNNIAAARAIAEAVKSTLGPKGMDKMLVDSLGDITITNDGATILKEVDVQHPAAKMIIEVAKSQDSEVGDGTTSVVVLAGELLKHAEELLEQNVHPTIITHGYTIAAQKAVEMLPSLGIEIKDDDEEALKEVAITALTSKNVGGVREHLAGIAVKAVKAIVEEVDGRKVADVDLIKVEKKVGGAIGDTELIDGIVLDKEKVHPRMPTLIKEAKIALINSALEIKKPEISAKIQITDPSQMQMFLEEEEKELRRKVDKIIEAGANVVFCQKGIDDMAQHFLAKAGIYAVRRVKKSDMEKLAKATGAKIVNNLDDLSPADLGYAQRVEEVRIGDDHMTFVRGCRNPKSVSILIRGGTEHAISEVERALHDALKVVGVAIEDGVVVPGGGAPEIELSLRLREYAPSVGGREQLAIEAFAKALEGIPRALAENAGLDAIDILIELKSAHEKGNKSAGVDVINGRIADMVELKVIEPLRVKKNAIQSATEVANMVLRIDDVIAARPMKEDKGKGGGGPGMGMGGMPPGMM